jgi:branched-subunit amino acid aminotransferase/4-amino-4-deoxychorismate lyase
MQKFSDIARTMGQVRSEMRFAVARELPIPAIAMANAHLCRLDESIRHFKFRLPSEHRRDPATQQLLRDLQRLHEDLIHFYGKGDPMETSEQSKAIVIPPMEMLSSQLIGKIS